jgi:hypothetical protein
MWNLKCKIIPLIIITGIIIGATGIITEVLNQNLETMSGKRSVDSLQKTSMLGTSHIIRKVLQSET